MFKSRRWPNRPELLLIERDQVRAQERVRYEEKMAKLRMDPAAHAAYLQARAAYMASYRAKKRAKSNPAQP